MPPVRVKLVAPLATFNLYRLICERGLKQALILEDDAKLTPEAISLLPQLALCDIPSKPLLTASCQYLKKTDSGIG